MAPPIGTTDSTHDSPTPRAIHGGAGEISQASAVIPPLGNASPFNDYAYRIVALTAGLAMITTFL
jgi:hypothetical protein